MSTLKPCERTQLIQKIANADQIAFGEDRSQDISRYLTNIHSMEDVIAISKEPQHILFHWLPAITYSLFGFQVYESCPLNLDSPHTFLLYHPHMKEPFDFIATLEKNYPFKLTIHEIVYTKQLIALIYGGFPWFDSFFAACDHYQFWNRKTKVYEIESQDGSDCISTLCDLKNKYRDENTHLILRQSFPDFDFPGIINPFHSPNKIENVQHSSAISKMLLKEGGTSCHDIF